MREWHTMDSSETRESVSHNFNLEEFLTARSLTMKIVEKFKEKIFVGMNEDQGIQILDNLFAEYNVEKKWHPTKFRIGINTTKSFKDISQENIHLKDEDIYFVDIGPVLNGHEGDYGKTFMKGQNQVYKDIIEASVNVFNETKRKWQEDNLSGAGLYSFAKECAKKFGFKLNEKMSGHRVGDFPHHVFYRGGLNEFEKVPSTNLWVLEIHLIDEKNQIGAFFEDVLIKI